MRLLELSILIWTIFLYSEHEPSVLQLRDNKDMKIFIIPDNYRNHTITIKYLYMKVT